MAFSAVIPALVLVWLIHLREVTGQAPCTLQDVATLSDFNLTRFLGRWNEIEWIAPTFQDNGSMWSDYYNFYTADSLGLVTGYYSGKDPNTGQCFIGGLMLLPTTDSGKLLLYNIMSKHSVVYSPDLLDYWIMSTDYSSYAVVYSCLDRADNTCTRARSWLWSRTTSLPVQVKESARAIFQKLCMNLTLLYSTSFSSDSCAPQTKDECASRAPRLLRPEDYGRLAWVVMSLWVLSPFAFL